MSSSEASNDKKLNLLFITSTLYLGGVQKVTCILANALAERHNVTVAYCFDFGKSHTLSDKCAVRKLPGYDSSADRLTKLRIVRKQIKALKALKKELDIDVSISLGNIANNLNARSKGKERVVCSERSNPQKSWGRLFFLICLAYRKADFVVFQSENVRSMFGSAVQEKSCILKNPVLLPPPADGQRKKKIVTMGRLLPQKNQKMLIRSFALFHKHFPEHTLHIFGEGEMEKELRQQIAVLGLEAHVFLEGNDPRVHDRIRDAEMFVLSSEFEGLSNALLECMSMGIACISTRCEGSVDVIRNGENGLLVDIGDETGLMKAMCLLADDAGLRRKLERQAREDIRVYDKDIVTKSWEQVIRKTYENAASAGKGAPDVSHVL